MIKLLSCFNPMQYTLFSTVGSDYAGGDDMIKLLSFFNPMQYTLFSTVGSDYAGGDDMMKELKNVTKVIIK